MGRDVGGNLYDCVLEGTWEPVESRAGLTLPNIREFAQSNNFSFGINSPELFKNCCKTELVVC